MGTLIIIFVMAVLAFLFVGGYSVYEWLDNYYKGEFNK